ncbi:MAG TPA: hypothetical protein P5120_17095 [Spirochaetota bacterium]|nr:hypothetical protein [Spirochaetota bacterium]HRX49239.1 hypothetical protein [Spirochaetota bacterium]
MLKTYKAQIKKNSIKWLDDKPEESQKNDSFIVYVTILKNEEKKNSTKDSLINFFSNSPLYDLDIDLERDKDPGREVIL